MLTDEQRREFDRNGILHLPGAIPRTDIDEMLRTVWDCLHDKYRIERDAPETWPRPGVEELSASHRFAGTHHLPESVTFAEIASGTVCAAIDDLLGVNNWRRPERWGSLLVAFPESQDRWEIPWANWHLDSPASRSSTGIEAVRVFACLAELAPGGGGTLFITGSHRLVQNLVEEGQRLKSQEARKALVRLHPWLKSLCSKDDKDDRVERYMHGSANLNGIEARVVEMTGEPGDVFLAHPLILHAPALNSSTRPRIVLSATVSRSDAAQSNHP